MKIRPFADSDIHPILSLFCDTVHAVNKKNYSQEQLDAGAPRADLASRLEGWLESMRRNVTYIAEIGGAIVGFADMTPAGHLDRVYVHKDYQGQGIATALVKKLEADAERLGLAEIDTEASITAKPFFERRGYREIRRQSVERQGVRLVNFKMVKDLSAEGQY